MAFPPGWETDKGFAPVPGIGQNLRFFRAASTGAGGFGDAAYSFADTETPQKPTPYITPGSTAPVAFGDRSFRGGVLGGGNDPRDAATFYPFDATTVGNPVTNKQPVAVNLRYAISIQVRNKGAADIELSFDGTTVHGIVPAGTTRLYDKRREAGISLRGVALAVVAFEVEAW